ncbi:hypothetical protein NEMBOFW57_002489 [Staphylotrichum longicolle]|uniref:Myb-like DNA-binding domain protein n=1 Tax=Staphylotrichum longicolle TaxID=669026 RepID=A0AAD4F3K6_9PEZI|nr:hypothetical protein NEMBOFW57_002489 [Staphylotrichum longicolle]
MEPPTKRPRFGPAPFDNDPYDDPDADELNERPEDVNARRDPAARLERSRAFAAFKLKSAFERIFEKYERDFTGVGDEIDLRTGEIVVDNGHIHSLKEAELGEAEGENGDSGDGASEAGSLNEEERLLRGREDHRYSRVGGQLALPVVSVLPQIGTSPLLGGGWLGPPPLMGGSPGFTSMTYPGQMHFGSFPMQYPVPIPTPSADPTWRTPELPSPFVKNVLMLGEAPPLVRKKAARLSLSAAREQDGGDEDDIFLDMSTSVKDKGEKQDLCVKQKVLVARPPPEKFSTKKSLAGPGPMKSRDAVQVGKPRKLGKASSEKQTPVRAGPRQSLDAAESGKPTGASRPQQSALRQCNPKLNPEDPNVYVNLSGRKLTRKPHGQALRVELPESKPPDIHSFRSITPEPSDADLMQPHTLLDASTITKVLDPSQAVPKGAKALEIHKRAQAVPVEAFSRNFVDPAYAFSDEDEPALPRGRVSRKPSKAVKTTNIGPGALREISHNVSLQETSRQWKTTVDEPLPQGDDGVVVRAESPALTTAKRKGILSLLPFNANDPEDDEDELSFLTPVKPAPPPGTLRSTPAGHHVRLALSAPGSGSSSSRGNPFAPSTSSSAAASKLKRTVLANGRKKSALGGGGSAGGAGPMTPSSTRRGAEAESLLVQTPGGTMRRCGEEGFRDYAFVKILQCRAMGHFIVEFNA